MPLDEVSLRRRASCEAATLESLNTLEHHGELLPEDIVRLLQLNAARFTRPGPHYLGAIWPGLSMWLTCFANPSKPALSGCYNLPDIAPSRIAGDPKSHWPAAGCRQACGYQQPAPATAWAAAWTRAHALIKPETDPPGSGHLLQQAAITSALAPSPQDLRE